MKVLQEYKAQFGQKINKDKRFFYISNKAANASMKVVEEAIGFLREVNYVMITDGWNMNMMREMFGEEICDHVITNFGTSLASNERDKPWCMSNSKGNLTVGSAFELLGQRKDN
uniref:Uncharacterized protein n=1 Tax=Solanum tuberosum TaxID=4113 RepID=M1DNX6_SOLTU